MNYIRASIRFALFVISTIILYAFWWVTSIFIPNKQYWRQVVFRVWAKIFAILARMKIEINGVPPKPPFFLVTNHLGYVDIPALRLSVDGVFVAKNDIKDWFLAGRICRDMGMIFIDRKNRRDIPRAGAEIIKRLSESEGVILFPEGTSTKGEDILPFNSSFLEFAAGTDLPVFYASIGYRTPEGEPAPSERICWWDDTGFLKHFWRLFSLAGFTAVISFGDAPVLNSNRKELASELRNKIMEHFVPVI